jgi:hypothetical protein
MNNMKKISILTVSLCLMGNFIYGQEAVIKPKNVAYTNEKFRDPFESQLPVDATLPKPVEQNKTEEAIILPQFNVEGVIWGTEMPLVIIEGSVLKTGDFIKEAQIIDIKKDRVEVLYQGRTFFIGTTFINKEN